LQVAKMIKSGILSNERRVSIKKCGGRQPSLIVGIQRKKGEPDEVR